jgi:hypothetical protein
MRARALTRGQHMAHVWAFLWRGPIEAVVAWALESAYPGVRSFAVLRRRAETPPLRLVTRVGESVGRDAGAASAPTRTEPGA